MQNLVNSSQLDNMYKTLSNLNLMELNEVMDKLVKLRKQKLTSVLSHTETKLLRKINALIPTDIHERYTYLITKKTNKSLSQDEYHELLELTSYFENVNAKRLKNIIELAKIKNKTYDEVIDELELNDIENVT